jgi:hypothetical protein
MVSQSKKLKRFSIEKWFKLSIFLNAIFIFVIIFLMDFRINIFNFIFYLFLIVISVILFFAITFEFKSKHLYDKFLNRKYELLIIPLGFLIFAGEYWSHLFKVDKSEIILECLFLISTFYVVHLLKKGIQLKEALKENQVSLEENRGLIKQQKVILEHIIKYNPIYAASDTFKKSMLELVKLNSIGLATKFSHESLEQMGKLGYLKIDVSFYNYTKYLHEVIESSKQSVIGSITVRPKDLYNMIKQDNYKYYSEYIDLLNKKKDFNRKRIIILSVKEIIKILQDANSELQENESGMLHIPEIMWFQEKINFNFEMYWTTDTLFMSNYISQIKEIEKLVCLYNNKITDFAIFDGQLLISWRLSLESREDLEDYGTLLLSWKPKVAEFNKIFYVPNKSEYQAKKLFPNFNDLINFLKNSRNKNEDLQKIRDLITEIENKLSKGYTYKNTYANNVHR